MYTTDIKSQGILDLIQTPLLKIVKTKGKREGRFEKDLSQGLILLVKSEVDRPSRRTDVERSKRDSDLSVRSLFRTGLVSRESFVDN